MPHWNEVEEDAPEEVRRLHEAFGDINKKFGGVTGVRYIAVCEILDSNMNTMKSWKWCQGTREDLRYCLSQLQDQVNREETKHFGL